MWIDITKKIGTLSHNESYEGERIEQKVERFVNGGEPISDEAPLIYTERKDGVRPEYDIRSDRFDIGLDAMDYVTKSERAKTVNLFTGKDVESGEKGEPSGQSTEATNESGK